MFIWEVLHNGGVVNKTAGIQVEAEKLWEIVQDATIVDGVWKKLGSNF